MNQSFIQKMIAKYGGDMQGGVSMAPVMPINERYGTNNSPDRYTGNGAPDEPAGIVHGKEYVLDEPTVEALGGEDGTKEKIDMLKAKKMRGYQEGGFVDPNYNTDTGFRIRNGETADQYNTRTAGRTTNSRKPMSEKAPGDPYPTVDPAIANPTRGSNVLTDPEPVEPPVSSDVTATNTDLPDYTPTDISKTIEGMLDRKPSEFRGVTQEGISGLSDIARGKSKGLDAVEEQQTTELAGIQTARGTGAAQEAAQMGLEGGTARSAAAQETRQSGAEMGELKGRLGAEKMMAAQNASAQLVQAGFQGEQLEEMKFQADNAIKKWGAEFTEDMNKYGVEAALNKNKISYARNVASINSAVAAGDYEGANAIRAQAGLPPVDYAKIETAEGRATYNDAMAGLSANYTAGIDDPNVQRDLRDAYMAENPDGNYDSPEGQAWAERVFKGIERNGDPIFTQVHSISPETVDSWFDEGFEYEGLTGTDAGYAVLTDGFRGGGMAFDENGNLEPNPDWEGWPESMKFTAPTTDTGDEIIGFDATTQDIFGTDANDILKAGRTEGNGEAYDAIVAGRVKSITEAVPPNYSKLLNLSENDPVVKGVLEKSQKMTNGSKGKFHGTGKNRTYEFDSHPEIGATINHDGKLYTVKSYGRGFQNIKWTTADKDFENMVVVDPLTGKETTINADHSFNP